ncbi:MAG: tRNA (adenosine(37)-N6)-threonylcarbamoyltransferase complex dimerization subunit type 1 TsaB [Deltaproteobacteria bacterium]|nr:tRNA (adenosine(37)-N6)-threonylcarbamoyltransferase complex dimerization subunit type 1 TsaB [Deltaproteobacteria bacterium]
MILGIDTATATASVAIVEEGKLILEEARSAPKQGGPGARGNHAEILLPLIDAVLSRASLSLSEISAFAVSLGPGSFTGLRIGLSTVKGLAYGWEIPVVGVPTLPAIATRVTGWEGLVCPFLDARKKEVYAALFRRRDGALERLTEDLVSSPDAIIDRAAVLGHSEPCLFIGDGIKAYGNLITTALADRGFLTLGEAYPSTACAVAQLGEARVRRQEFDSVGTMIPLYLRPSEAELKKRVRS